MTTSFTPPIPLAFLQAVHEGDEGYVEFRFLGGGYPKTFFCELPLKEMPEMPAGRPELFLRGLPALATGRQG